MDALTIQLKNTLRLIAATSDDKLSKAIALDVLGEASAQVESALMNTCFGETVRNGPGDFRAIAKLNLAHSSHSEVAGLLQPE